MPTAPPILPPNGVQSSEIQAQTAVLHELQKQAMQQQAELGARQASAQVLCCTLLSSAVPYGALLCSAVCNLWGRGQECSPRHMSRNRLTALVQ